MGNFLVITILESQFTVLNQISHRSPAYSLMRKIYLKYISKHFDFYRQVCERSRDRSSVLGDERAHGAFQGKIVN